MGERNKKKVKERMVVERSQRLSASQSPEVREVREECFQGLQSCPTRALLRMHQDNKDPQAGRAPAQASQSTLTSRPCHAEGVFPLEWSSQSFIRLKSLPIQII